MSEELRNLWKRRIEFLEVLRFPHKHYSDALSEIRAMADTPTLGDVLLLSGPTGAGKSTVLHEFIRKEAGLKPEESIALARDRCPYLVWVEVRYPHQRPYRPRLLYVDSLEYLCNALAGRHMRYKGPNNPFRDINNLFSKSSLRDSQDRLRYYLEKAFDFHRITKWVIDEAQDMFIGSRGNDVDDLLGIIKSISNRGSTLPILAGTYDLACAFDFNAQWNRRVTIVHLARYNVYTNDGLQEWVNVVASFQDAIGEWFTFDLLKDAEFLGHGSLGIIGELAKWLTRSMRLALAKDMTLVSKGLVAATSHNPAQLLRLRKEAIGGEKRILGLLEKKTEQAKRESTQHKKPRRKSHRYATGGVA